MFARWSMVYFLGVLLAVLAGVAAWQQCIIVKACGTGSRSQLSVSELRDELVAARLKLAVAERGLREARAQIAREASAREAAEVAFKAIEQRANDAQSGVAGADRGAAELRAHMEELKASKEATERTLKESLAVADASKDRAYAAEAQLADMRQALEAAEKIANGRVEPVAEASASAAPPSTNEAPAAAKPRLPKAHGAAPGSPPLSAGVSPPKPRPPRLVPAPPAAGGATGLVEGSWEPIAKASAPPRRTTP
jgi:hypothetical protein